jgi:hypothetical protein
MHDEALSELLKTHTDPGEVTAPEETVSTVMRTVAVAECLKALAEFYLLVPLEVLDRALDGNER